MESTRHTIHRRRTVPSTPSFQPPTIPFLRLPVELLCQILGYLDEPSAVCLRLANRYLYASLPMNDSPSSESVKIAIQQQIQGYRMCSNCQIYRAKGAFPHLIGEWPDVITETGGYKGQLEKFTMAKENITRLRKRKKILKNCGLVYIDNSLCVNNRDWAYSSDVRWKVRVQIARALERAKVPADVLHNKQISRHLPMGGWARGLGCYGPRYELLGRMSFYYWFGYAGRCGWKCNSNRISSWTWTCSCLRCSDVASTAHRVCCWCDPNDSRYEFLNWISSDDRTTKEILFTAKLFPYGIETSWVGTIGSRDLSNGEYLDRESYYSRRFGRSRTQWMSEANSRGGFQSLYLFRECHRGCLKHINWKCKKHHWGGPNREHTVGDCYIPHTFVDGLWQRGFLKPGCFNCFR